MTLISSSLLILLHFVLIGSFSFNTRLLSLYTWKQSIISDCDWLCSQSSNTVLHANPVTSEGSNYGKYTNEEDAFLWFDEALFYVRAGSGGAGSNAVKFGAGRQHRYPTGGNGGNGGNIYLVADSNVNTLLGFRGSSHFRAENGIDGALEYSNGKVGKDFYISVPKGIIIKDNETNAVIGELNYVGDKILVAKGGLGGRGNAASKSATDMSLQRPPTGGERKWLKIELKLVADVGLIGLPNAGKSTLLNAITNARPKIASYAFTTIVPNLGVCEIDRNKIIEMDKAGSSASSSSVLVQKAVSNTVSNTVINTVIKESSNNIGGENKFDRMVIADIPGLIEGAHEGKGLGRGFLRHVERCKILLHLVDGSSADAVSDYLTINNELSLFSSILASKPQIVILNKIDIEKVSDNQQEIITKLQAVMSHKRLLLISAAAHIGTEELIMKTYLFLEKIKMDEWTQLQQRQAVKNLQESAARRRSLQVTATVTGGGNDDDGDVDDVFVTDDY